jgi:hypothetical protein
MAKLSDILKSKKVSIANDNNDSIPEVLQNTSNSNQINIENNIENNIESTAIPEQVSQAIHDLQAQLEAQNQDIRSNLILIHRALAKNPNIVTILSNEERASIFQGYKKQAGIEEIAKAAKKKGSSKNKDISAFM